MTIQDISCVGQCFLTVALPNSCHGTGDYAAECIKCTAQLDNHWYGAAFEPVLGKLIEMLK